MVKNCGHETFSGTGIWLSSSGLSYYDRSDVSYVVNQAFRKDVRCGLGMRKDEPIHDRLKDGFQEAMTRAKDMNNIYKEQDSRLIIW